MNKELEALKRLYDKADYSSSRHSADRDFELVEKAVKEWEQLKMITTPLSEKDVEDVMKVVTKLKAFYIIKEKQVCVYLLDGCDNVKQYNKSMDLMEMPKDDRHKYHLTKEEFDSVKEALKNA